MANKIISMQKTRQVLRLRSQGKGIKAISSLLSLVRNTVKKHLSRLEESGLDFESALALRDMDLTYGASSSDGDIKKLYIKVV